MGDQVLPCRPGFIDPISISTKIGFEELNRVLQRCPGPFRAMRLGDGGNLGNFGNVESVTCRPHYSGEGTNPPPLRSFKIIVLRVIQSGIDVTTGKNGITGLA